MTLIARAKDEDSENRFAAGKEALLSVHKELSNREEGQGMSRSAKKRSVKRKRVETVLDMPQNENIGDEEVEGNDADGSFQLDERDQLLLGRSAQQAELTSSTTLARRRRKAKRAKRTENVAVQIAMLATTTGSRSWRQLLHLGPVRQWIRQWS